MITFGSTNINSETGRLMSKALRNGEIGQTEVIEEFEGKFAKFMGKKYAIAVCNGTMADTIALAVLKEFFPLKRSVVVPALTFIAQINSLWYNHLRPVFYDTPDQIRDLIDEDTLCVFPVHLLGFPTFITADVPIIEDACEALGSKKKGKLCGTYGDMGTFSFFPSHTLSTGEGGMIITDNADYASMARRMRNHGKEKSNEFRFDVIGFNGKMSALSAIVGIGAVAELHKAIEKRHGNFIALGGKEEEGDYVVPHGFPSFYEYRDSMMSQLRDVGIDCRQMFSSIPTQEKAYAFLAYKKGRFPRSEWIGEHGLYVPCHQGLNDKELKYIKEYI